MRDVEVSDCTLAQWPNGHDVLRCSADHLPGLVTHGQNFTVVLIKRDYRRLVKNDAFPFGVDQRVGRTQIDRKVACQN